MSITTKTGDKGDTSLIGGVRVSKASPIINLLGELDELNSALGMCRADGVLLRLREVQMDIMKMMGEIANTKGDALDKWTGVYKVDSQKEIYWNQKTEQLEKWISEGEATLPELKNFLIPGGADISTRIMFSRAVCRRVERVYVTVFSPNGQMRYLNRLSDYLFISSRIINHNAKLPEDLWITK